MNTINGLPAHVLLVHAIVVLIPLSAFLLILTAVWPAARRRFAGPNALLAIGALVMIPITTQAGGWLERRVPPSALVERHTNLGDTALWFSLPVTLLAIAVWWRTREASARSATSGRSRRAYLAPGSARVTVLIAVLSVVAAGLAAVDIYLIGDSGAQASWDGRVSATSTRP
jgi:hypothetical protein